MTVTNAASIEPLRYSGRNPVTARLSTTSSSTLDGACTTTFTRAVVRHRIDAQSPNTDGTSANWVSVTENAAFAPGCPRSSERMSRFGGVPPHAIGIHLFKFTRFRSAARVKRCSTPAHVCCRASPRRRMRAGVGQRSRGETAECTEGTMGIEAIA